MTIELQEIDLKAMAPDITKGGQWKAVPLVQRIDPLTRRSSRILTGVKLQPDTRSDLSELISRKGFCPFCDGTVEDVTFPFESEVVSEGRIRKNRALVVPNIMAYSGYSSVGIYDTSRHFLALDDLTLEILIDAFSVMVQHAVGVRKHRPELWWSSINANYLPSSGSSILHPHLQSSHDLQPTWRQAEMVEGAKRYHSQWAASYFEDLLSLEKAGPRFLGNTGSVAWLTPFAPQGFQEIWGIFDSISDVTEMTDGHIGDLSKGLEAIFRYYDSKNFSAFNYSLTGGGPDGAEIGYRLNFRIVVRSNPEKYYRSDVTYFERLLDEPLIDVFPEQVAQAASRFFR